MLVWLARDSHDAFVRALGFLDVVSLVHCEMSSKFVKNAASDAWIAVDKAIDAKRKAYGETPRQRAIRSSPIYRRHLLSQYAARVEKLRPSSSEALLYGAEVMQGDDYDFYIRFATVVDEERDEYWDVLVGSFVPPKGPLVPPGPNRGEETMFLA